MSLALFGVIQARMGSQRLPGKVMLDLGGKPMVGHIFDRLRRLDRIDGIVLATTSDPLNEPLVRYAQSCNVVVWREPSEDDIASRLHHAAGSVGASAILKVNADCPLIDCAVLDLIIDRYLESKVSYVSNKYSWTWPKGLSAEVIASGALDWCHRHLISRHDREYVADWIKNHPDRFPGASVESDVAMGHLDWMVDTQADMDWMRSVFSSLYKPGGYFGFVDVLAHTMTVQ